MSELVKKAFSDCLSTLRKGEVNDNISHLRHVRILASVLRSKWKLGCRMDEVPAAMVFQMMSISHFTLDNNRYGA
jgi:hypothetical protein